jgi:hypothetical protein
MNVNYTQKQKIIYAPIEGLRSYYCEHHKFWQKYLIVIILMFSPYLVAYAVILSYKYGIIPVSQSILKELIVFITGNKFHLYFQNSLLNIFLLMIITDLLLLLLKINDHRKVKVIYVKTRRQQTIGDSVFNDTENLASIINLLNNKSKGSQIENLVNIKNHLLKITKSDLGRLKLLREYFGYFEKDNFWPVFGSTLLAITLTLISILAKSKIVNLKLDSLSSQPLMFIFIESLFYLCIAAIYFMYVYVMCTNKKKKNAFIRSIIELCIEEKEK